MKIFNRVLGVQGESFVVQYLKKKKYKILETNYKNFIGEIDIVAKDKNCLVFIEVKSRSSFKYGLPCEAVDYRKQSKIRRIAAGYMKEKHLNEQECRCDVIEVIDDEINHIENAF